MLEYLDYDTFLTQMIMHEDPVLIVEGRNDIDLYTEFFGANIVITSPEVIYDVKNNKQEIIKIIKDINEISKMAHSDDYRRYLGIIDTDFNGIFSTYQLIDNLFYTDKHDIDAQIFSTLALEKVIRHFFQNSKKIDVQGVRDKCLEIASKLGYFKLVLYDLGKHNCMKELSSIYELFNKDLIFRELKITQQLKDFCNKGVIEEDNLVVLDEKINDYRSQDLDQYHLSNGHDIIRVFTMLILWELYGLNKKGLSPVYRKHLLENVGNRDFLKNELETILRTSYELIYFQESKMYGDILKYQKTVRITFLKEK